MIDRRSVLAALGAFALLPAVANAADDTDKVVLTDAQWRARLSPEAFDILRRQGTEAPFSSPLDHETRAGTYFCAGCDLALYSSKTKYDSGTGWPSFWAPLPHAIAQQIDNSLPEQRDEVHCRRCAGHLGHVFDDGPPPTGKRYCMDGVALKFKPA
jgi:peptide-methionine (R)-S-oxide reductase